VKRSDQEVDETMDINAAWEKFKKAVAEEPVPDFWLNSPDDLLQAGETGHAQAQYSEQIHNSEHAPAQYGEQIHNSEHAPAQYSEQIRLSFQDESKSNKKRLKHWMNAGIAAAIVALLVFTSWGQEALADVLQSFRVQHLQTVSLSQDDLNHLQQTLSQGSLNPQSFDLKQYGQLETVGGGKTQEMSVTEAIAFTGWKVKFLPGADAGAMVIKNSPRIQLTLKLHITPINKLISQLGGKILLPNSVEGKPITLDIPGMIQMTKGTRNLIQLKSPTLSVPDNLDVDQVRQAVLNLPVLPQDLRSKLAGIGDWQHTLPIPAIGDAATQLTIAGCDAVFMNKEGRLQLVWLDHNVIYQLSGSPQDYPTEQAIIAEAKEIITS